MTIDTNALYKAADDFSRSMEALNSMQIAGLPPELDQDVRDICRIIQEHGPGYCNTVYGDLTAPLLESLNRLVQVAKGADRLAGLEAENQRLREALSDYYHQHKCGCGHPACKRCRDDRHVEEALAAGGEKC